MRCCLNRSYLFSTVRVYANIFTLTNLKYTLSADLIPPLLTSDSQIVRIKYNPSLRFTTTETSKRFLKGNKLDIYFLRGQEVYQFAVWKPKNGRFQQARQNKAVILAQSSETHATLTVFNKDLEEEERKKQFECSFQQLSLFQALTLASMQHGTNLRRHQMHAANLSLSRLQHS